MPHPEGEEEAVPTTERRLSFILKLIIAGLLTAAADFLFYKKEPGSTLGVFAFLWILGLAAGVPAIRKQGAARLALALAALPALALMDYPNPLSWALFWTALFSAVILSRHPFHDAAQHLSRLFLQGAVGWLAPLRDAMRLMRLPRPRLRNSLLRILATLAVPLAGAAIFTALFASANPLVERLLPKLAFPELDFLLILFSAAAFVLVWTAFRPIRFTVHHRFGIARPGDLPGVTSLSVLISLFLFNAIFAVENGLDIAFLWSGASLPAGMTMAEYAHRGAYPLIATALLAGAFVLITAHPDTEIGRHPLIRRLVALWTAQNLILVASSIIRTVDYIDAYMLTRLRIAALVWMALVAAGLVLICLRILWRRPLAWLINRVAAAALIVLFGCSLVDFGAVAAAWNVRHAREAGGTGQNLDIAYLVELGPSALTALTWLESQPMNGDFRDRIAYMREEAMRDAIQQQKRKYGWTWRNARRLSSVEAMLAAHPHASKKTPCGRQWDGRIKACPPRAVNPASFTLRSPDHPIVPPILTRPAQP
jgi:hypothetical protein